jgi:hypothetical protein
MIIRRDDLRLEALPEQDRLELENDVENTPGELPGLCNELVFMCRSCGHTADRAVGHLVTCHKCGTANWERVPQRMVQRGGDRGERREELPGSPRRAGPRTKEYREPEHTPGPARVRRLVLPRGHSLY